MLETDRIEKQIVVILKGVHEQLLTYFEMVVNINPFIWLNRTVVS